MKTEILKMLREADGYVSGQQISEKFGVSRTRTRDIRWRLCAIKDTISWTARM